MKEAVKTQVENFELGLLSELETIRLFQDLINSGEAWVQHLSVSSQIFGKILEGKCAFGLERHFAPCFGRFVPSRLEVPKGALGSAERVNRYTGADPLDSQPSFNQKPIPQVTGNVIYVDFARKTSK